MRFRWTSTLAGGLASMLLASSAAVAVPQLRRGDRARVERTTHLRGAVRARRGRPVTKAAPPREERAIGSVSVGRPNRGRLVNGVLLGETETLRWRNPNEATRWGTEELVGLLQDGAQHVAAELPGAQLSVGDLSRRGGGRFRPHRSHTSGRDVDVGFYMSDASGAPSYAPRFVEFRADGVARGEEERRLDDARNWELLESWLGDGPIPVQWIFVSNEIKGRLLAEAARRGASAEIIARAEAVLQQPRRGGRHRDHFHVRIYCPHNDKPRCVDEPPFYPWVRAASADTSLATGPLAIAPPDSAP
jgi:penicillin-insensitive murein endopeptidase